jgi:LmbE family N-acetylglucosaminyl deacetylase
MRLHSWGETSGVSDASLLRAVLCVQLFTIGDTGSSAAPEAIMTEPVQSPHRWRPARFMVVAAHPDDAEFGPAGTAATWIDAGSVGWLVCCTSGDQGGEDPDADPLELAAIREAEQRAAAGVVGYAGVSFLHAPDGALVNDLALRELLVREIRTFRPDAVLTTDPETLFHGDGGVNHTDHRAAGLAAVDAVYPAARNPMAFPALARSGLAAHVVRRLYLFWSNHPNVRVEIGERIERKIAALSEHRSQIRDFEGLTERIRAWAAEEGGPIGGAPAEAFRLVVIDDDEDEGPSVDAEAAADLAIADAGAGA